MGRILPFLTLPDSFYTLNVDKNKQFWPKHTHTHLILSRSYCLAPKIISNFVLFSIASSPVIINPPQNQTALDGKEATIACEAAGAPAPNVTWYFNDGQISFSGRLEILEDGSLLISNVRYYFNIFLISY